VSLPLQLSRPTAAAAAAAAARCNLKFLFTCNAPPQRSPGKGRRTVGLESTGGAHAFRQRPGITGATCSRRRTIESGERKTTCSRRRASTSYDGDVLRYFLVDLQSRQHCQVATFAEYLPGSRQSLVLRRFTRQPGDTVGVRNHRQRLTTQLEVTGIDDRRFSAVLCTSLYKLYIDMVLRRRL